MWLHAALVLDLVSIKLFVWTLAKLFPWSTDSNGGLLDSHLFFYDRYTDLAEYHRLKGSNAKARRLAAIAEAHYRAAPDDDGPPEAAAMGMPLPRPFVRTNAVSTHRLPKPAAEPPSELTPWATDL